MVGVTGSVCERERERLLFLNFKKLLSWCFISTFKKKLKLSSTFFWGVILCSFGWPWSGIKYIFTIIFWCINLIWKKIIYGVDKQSNCCRMNLKEWGLCPKIGGAFDCATSTTDLPLKQLWPPMWCRNSLNCMGEADGELCILACMITC